MNNFLIYDKVEDAYLPFNDLDDAEVYLRYRLSYAKEAGKCQLYRWYDTSEIKYYGGIDEDMLIVHGDEDEYDVFTRYEYARDVLPEEADVHIFIEVPLEYSVTLLDREVAESYGDNN